MSVPSLHLLSCDHRTSFVRLFGARGADSVLLVRAKDLVAAALLEAVTARRGSLSGPPAGSPGGGLPGHVPAGTDAPGGGLPGHVPAGTDAPAGSPAVAGLLADATYGAGALRSAAGGGLFTAVAVQASGKRWFEFERPDWRDRAVATGAGAVKVSLRWNPDDPVDRRSAQTAALRDVAGWAAGRDRPLLLELLVPPTEVQLAGFHGDVAAFDRRLRAELTVRAIGQVRAADVHPRWWAVGGLETVAECAAVAAAAGDAGCLVVGDGGDPARVDHWLAAAAPVAGFTGFAIGRSAFWPALGDWADGAAGSDDTIARIRDAYLHAVDVWTRARGDRTVDRTTAAPASGSVPSPEAEESTVDPEPGGRYLAAEIASQPDMWRRAATLAADAGVRLPPGRVAFVGCGTSYFMAQSLATLWERGGRGEADAFAASEMPTGRRYDRVVLLSRSGTTTEVVRLAGVLRGTPTVAVVGVAPGPLADLADEVIDLTFADERSVVQTRFATSTVALVRALVGHDVPALADEAAGALAQPLPDIADARAFVFLGTGFSVGLAHEAALKMREAALTPTESYPAMEYRHGPIALAGPGTVVWFFGTPPDGLVSDVAETGATVIARDADPLVELVRAQRIALDRARRAGLDPDAPPRLTRSVVLRPVAF